MNVSQILERAAELVEQQSLSEMSTFDAIAISAGNQPGEVLTDEAYGAARSFAHWLGFDANDELSVAQALSGQWGFSAEQTPRNVSAALRKASVHYARGPR